MRTTNRKIRFSIGWPSKMRKAETAIAQAVEKADANGVSGKALTPFLLARLVELTGGQARRANEALLLNNARVAVRIARALAASKS